MEVLIDGTRYVPAVDASPAWPDRDMLEAAWGIIANVDVGDWSRQRPEWQRAAAVWRDAYHRAAQPSTKPFVDLLPTGKTE